MKIRPKKVLLYALIVLLITGIAACLGGVGYLYLQERSETDAYRETAQQFTAPRVVIPEAPEPMTDPFPTPQATEEPITEEASVYTINADYTALSEINSDVRGWLCIPETGIDYPVLQCGDNSTYLRRGLDGKYSRSGSAFLDCKIDLSADPDVFLIYGHAMGTNSDLMFSRLLGYKEQAFMDAHPEIYLSLLPEHAIDGVQSNTEEGAEYTFRVFAVCLVDAFSEPEIAEHYPVGFEDADAFAHYVDAQRSQSIYEINTEGVPEKVLVLSTCANPGQYSDYRLLIYAGLFPDDDSIQSPVHDMSAGFSS